MTDATTAVLRELMDHLKAQMRTVENFQSHFPDFNQELTLPTITLTAGEPELMHCTPYIDSQGQVNENNQAEVLYVVGQYEFNLQLDIFAGNKHERSKILQDFMASFSSQFPIMGLSLKLSRYHDIDCRYDFLSERYEESELGSQTKDWRVIINLMAHCHRVMTRTEYLILNTELTIETKG